MPEALTPNPAETEMQVPVKQESAPTTPVAPEVVDNQAQLESYAQMSAAATTEGDKKFWNDKFVAAGGTLGNEKGGVEIASESDGGKDDGVVENLAGIVKDMTGLLKGGMSPEDPLVQTLLNRIPERSRGPFLEQIQAGIAAEAPTVKEKEPVIKTLDSRDAAKYKSRDRFDNGKYKGVVRSVDFLNNTIDVELDDQEPVEKAPVPEAGSRQEAPAPVETRQPETVEEEVPQTVNLENGLTVKAGDMLQVENIVTGRQEQVKIKSFDEAGRSVIVEDLDPVTGRSLGGRGGSIDTLLNKARLIKA